MSANMCGLFRRFGTRAPPLLVGPQISKWGTHEEPVQPPAPRDSPEDYRDVRAARVSNGAESLLQLSAQGEAKRLMSANMCDLLVGSAPEHPLTRWATERLMSAYMCDLFRRPG